MIQTLEYECLDFIHIYVCVRLSIILNSMSVITV